jgi:E3 ubiquitin-protein ligase makorin
VCPSKHWIDTPEEKAKLLVDYKDALTKKQCKYFKKGVGECPFGNKCFYRHENQGEFVVVALSMLSHVKKHLDI